jgi:hypothetical protein
MSAGQKRCLIDEEAGPVRLAIRRADKRCALLEQGQQRLNVIL